MATFGQGWQRLRRVVGPTRPGAAYAFRAYYATGPARGDRDAPATYLQVYFQDYIRHIVAQLQRAQEHLD